jgi:hypothetical protein
MAPPARQSISYRNYLSKSDITTMPSTSTFTTAQLGQSSLLSNVVDFVSFSRSRAGKSPFYMYGLRSESELSSGGDAGLFKLRLTPLNKVHIRYERAAWSRRFVDEHMH